MRVASTVLVLLVQCLALAAHADSWNLSGKVVCPTALKTNEAGTKTAVRNDTLSGNALVTAILGTSPEIAKRHALTYTRDFLDHSIEVRRRCDGVSVVQIAS